MTRSPALLLALPLAACGTGHAADTTTRDGNGFPAAARPVAAIVSDRWSNETDRDKRDEANAVMDRAGVRSGMTVADIGAGEGYYTVRLAKRVGEDGRVLAEDVVPKVRDMLAERAGRDRLDNVSVRLGVPADPRLPIGSFDRVLMVHMYHEIASPYEFLWRLRPALKPAGEVIVVDADRSPQGHGLPPQVLSCEFRALGYRRVTFVSMPQAGGYLSAFAIDGARPAPQDIHPCDAQGRRL